MLTLSFCTQVRTQIGTSPGKLCADYIMSYQVCLQHLPRLQWNTFRGENITYMYQLKALQTAASGGGDVVVVNVSTTYHSTFVQTKRCMDHRFVVGKSIQQ